MKDKKIGDGIFKLKKITSAKTLTDDNRHINVAPPLDLTRILKSYHKRNERSKFLEK